MVDPDERWKDVGALRRMLPIQTGTVGFDTSKTLTVYKLLWLWLQVYTHP